jgi:hypothetical protein
MHSIKHLNIKSAIIIIIIIIVIIITNGLYYIFSGVSITLIEIKLYTSVRQTSDLYYLYYS